MSQKVRNIYEALENGNYKNAIKLCVAFLKTNPAAPQQVLCKSLQSIALERCGRRGEALQLADEVRSSTPVQDTVLSHLAVLYRRCREYGKITAMYEFAWSQDEGNEDYAVSLFSAAIRQGEYAKAQQTAMKLYRKFNKPKYLHWVVVSILLQARGDPSSKVIDLGAMMLQKAPIDMEKLKDDGAVPFNRAQHDLLMLHLATLRQQKKYAQALEMLEACQKLVKLPDDMLALRRQLLTDAGNITGALAEAKKAALSRPHCLGTARELISLAFRAPEPSDLPRIRVASSSSGPATEVVDHGARLRRNGATPDVCDSEDLEKHFGADAVWNTLLLFQHLRLKAQAAGVRHAERVPRLAELEIWRTAFSRNEAQARLASSDVGSLLSGAGWKAAVADCDFQAFLHLVVEYAIRFSGKTSTLTDLKPYLCLLPWQDVAPLLESSKFDPADGQATAASMTLEKLRRSLRREYSDDELVARASESTAVLRTWAKAFAEQQAPKPSQADEDSLLFAALALLDADRATCRTQGLDGARPMALQSRRHLLQVMAVVERALSTWPHCFHFRVLLLLLYGSLGLPSAVSKCYPALEIKNIQHETLSYLGLDAFCASGCSEELRLVQWILGFHEDADKDASDALNMCFNSGVYHRVPEYLEFSDLMKRSVHWARSLVEEAMIDICQSQSWDALLEVTGRIGCELDAVAAHSVDHWTLRNQDRCLLSSTHVLPLCSPLASLHHSPGSWSSPGVAALPATTVRASPPRSWTSSAMIWDGVAAASEDAIESSLRPIVKDAVKAPQGAAEELLTRGADRAAALATMSAAQASTICALLHKDGAAEKRLAVAAESCKNALGSLGLDVEKDDLLIHSGLPTPTTYASADPTHFALQSPPKTTTHLRHAATGQLCESPPKTAAAATAPTER
eukprot:TRINITY_DN21382_c0_g2_i2.p1 TRINITY_DN21382_c0_g2~~TRINITY_DN21382_c0_g2_i2.p1  ORF type:complete len:937 (-),score=167.29 TRINITY_DN21382_c0_g2_i2:27-2762(-)